MRIRNQNASAAFKTLLALGAWAGILLQCDVFSGRASFSSLRYYTLLSNVLVAVYFSAAAVSTWKNRPLPLPVLKGALTMGITVTGLVFHLLLSDSDFAMGGTAAVANQLLHTFTPVMTVLDWLLFDKRGTYNKWSPLQWTVLPDAYLVMATIYGFCSLGTFYNGSRFPYFFIDYDALGAGRVLLNVLLMNAAFIALGYAFLLADRLLRRE